MSTSRSEPTVSLNVQAPELTTEIFVIDSRFRRLASGLGHLETEVAPGLYKIRFRSGNSQRDKLVEATLGNSPLYVTTPPLGFASAAPMVDTRTTREHHSHAAELHSYNTQQSRGNGSQLYIFLRDLQGDSTEPLWSGVSLHDLHGNQIADLTEGVCDANDAFAALNLDLDPGTYRLRVDSGPLGTFEMFLITCHNWQTQVFLLASDLQAGDTTVRRAILKTAAVFMARCGQGYHPNGDHVRLTELARQGLVHGRKVIKGDQLNQMLRGKFENPMLGIYGAHLLLAARRPKHQLINTVVNNLRDLLGIHTDVEAIAMRNITSDQAKHREFSTPPMLQKSWELIVKDSLRRMATVPAGSMTEQLTDGLLGSAPWLLYRTPSVQILQSREEDVNFAGARRMLEKMVSLGEVEVSEKLKYTGRDRASLTPLQNKILSATLDAGAFNQVAELAVGRGEEPSTVTVPQILRSLDAPSTAIARSTKELVELLGMSELKS
ncbi:MAG: hypothetical protein DRR42_15890 [Gammaproteobacteria bacterium]|nr:MAG: hypothetical protein DRR42_15890 [Gammaproteobacteria bacterium]